jgi:hypothetical protein
VAVGSLEALATVVIAFVGAIAGALVFTTADDGASIVLAVYTAGMGACDCVGTIGIRA